MVKIYIPVVGDVLQLEERTSLSLINDGQNHRFVAEHGDTIVLPKNTSIIVDRVCVRKRNRECFNGVTFIIPKNNATRAPRGRFFLPVETVNNLPLSLIKSAKVVPPKNPIKNLYNDCYRYTFEQDCCHTERPNLLWSRFVEQLFTQPNLGSGRINVSVAKNARNFQEFAQKTYSIEHNADNYLNLVVEKLLYSTPEVYDKCAMMSSVENCNVELTRLCEQEQPIPFFRFNIKQFNGEVYLHLFAISSGQEGLADARSIMSNAISLHEVLLRSLNGGYSRYFRDVFSVFDDNFGWIESEPQKTFVSPDKIEAILPFSAFSNNYLTITKPTTELRNGGLYFDLPLTFSLNGGESGEITRFRAAIRKIAKNPLIKKQKRCNIV